MRAILRSMLLLTLCALGTAAWAQSIDSTGAPPTGAPGMALHAVMPATGAPKALLWDNGPYITQTNAGAGGADVSEIEAGLSTYGLGQEFSMGNRIAEDFDVPAGNTWNLNTLRWLAYQTGAPTTGTITGCYTEYAAPGPNGAPIAGDTTTNQLLSTVWTGVYRVTTATITNTDRALIEVTADASFVPPLNSGNYWVRVMCDGSASFSGPWCPVTVPWDSSDNANQEMGIGTGFQPNISGQGNAPADHPFWLDGNLGGPCPPGVIQYCAQTKTTSVPGCLPSLCATSTSISTGHWVTSQVPLGPGVTNTVGVHIYTAGPGIGQSMFMTNTVYGKLCLQNFCRALPAVATSGIPVTCTGVFDYDVGANLGNLQSCNPAFQIGADTNVQGWYRDPPNAGNANFTNAIFYTLTP